MTTIQLPPFARVAEQRPEYCAYLLRAYLDEHRNLTLDDLVQRLACPPDRLWHLWMCLRPGECWERDVDRIARYVGCDRAVLAQLLHDALLLS